MRLTLLALFATLASASATVTLQFTITPNAAAGWANSAGQNNQTLVWGVIVDSSGNGFNGVNFNSFDGGSYASSASYDGGFSLAANVTGTLALTVGGVATDDIIYIGASNMATGGTFDGATGLAKITSISNMVYGAGINPGDSYAIVWFDTTARGTAQGNYGIYRESWMTLPNDPGTYDVSVNFAGAELDKTTNLTLVPEPSAALLGMLGALGLLRRRR